ncbi:HD domain-containing phosphohydrolase [Thiohalorhabdus sp. Cl-TMA]|uniref:HD domain-containing phosphohydrolase n=1 Tax=Thiohalorhabdus methylotrophus TaxID=3242694 RepID=A0ABV4TWS0_9GAMM
MTEVQSNRSVEALLERLERLNAIGTALSAERDTTRLLEQILVGAKELTGADGGTLYLKNEAGDALDFRIVRNDSLGIAMGGTSGETVSLGAVPLHDGAGAPNYHNVAAYAALTGNTVNIADAYTAEGYDFSGTRAFDEQTGYRSRSFLTLPLVSHEGEMLGVLQLLNAKSEADGAVTEFSPEDQRLAESLASQAAVALSQQQLIDAQRELFESFIRLIAKAIDEKSKHTSGHCQRVPELTMMIADAAQRAEYGSLAEYGFSSEERYELEIAAWLHDCGKVTTPEPVMDKETKLHAMYDRINAVDTRFEVLKRDAEIAALRERLAAAEAGREPAAEASEAAVAEQRRTLDEERDFLRRANVGGEFMPPEEQERVRAIGTERRWRGPDGAEWPLLDEDEIHNLSIAKGTLTPEEREVMKDHMRVTMDMLEALPYPRHLRRVPDLAGGHHERMDGQGYPRGLVGYENPDGARMMAIADVFEALTAADRPYKTPMPLSQALTIMGRMCEDSHFDPDLFDLFIRERVYMDYAERFLKPEQIDEVDESVIPGYQP